MEKPKVIVIGLGWGCASFLKTIDTSKYDVKVYSLDNNFVYTPLLAQNTKHSKELTIKGTDINDKVKFENREILDIDFQKNIVKTNKSENCSYDFLVLSHGATVNTFGIKGVEEHCFFLKTSKDAHMLRDRLQSISNGSNIAVIGCGLTGSELIGSLLDYGKFNIHAIDALPRPLIAFDESLSNFVLQFWNTNNVKSYMNHMVSYIDGKSIHIKNNKPILYDISIWCGGIKKSAFTEKLLSKLQLNDKKGLPVNEKLKIKNTNNVFAMGDCASSGFPPTAQVAYQQGTYLANQFNTNFSNNSKFIFKNKGQIGYVGKKQSVCQLPYFQSGGNLVFYLNKIIHVYNGVTWKQKWNLI
jgi:NADH:ubiquinone reductase (non-electrogenic)